MAYAPTVKTIRDRLHVSSSVAKDIRAILVCTRKRELYTLIEDNHAIFKSTDLWINKCYNEPPMQEIKLEMINELIGGHGIETLQTRKAYYSYVNMGDTYTPTIIWGNHRYFVSDWGTIAEREGTY